MGKNKLSHNDIVLSIDDDMLISLLKKEFGEKSCWSSFHWITRLEIPDWGLEKIKELNNPSFHIEQLEELDTLQRVKDKFERSSRIIEDVDLKSSFLIEKTFEFPLTKGEGNYKCTKGFIDLIVHIKPFSKGDFNCYKEGKTMEFIIEVKKEKDFEDFGNVLRQIKEYRAYYNNENAWTSNLIKESEYDSKDPIFCVLSTSIPNNVKKIFESENIKCLEVRNVSKVGEVHNH